MANSGTQQRLHPSRRHRDPMKTKNGKDRLKPLTIQQLTAMAEKTVRNRDRARVLKEIMRKQTILSKKAG